jgi:hypothetical protein
LHFALLLADHIYCFIRDKACLFHPVKSLIPDAMLSKDEQLFQIIFSEAASVRQLPLPEYPSGRRTSPLQVDNFKINYRRRIPFQSIQKKVQASKKLRQTTDLPYYI